MRAVALLLAGITLIASRPALAEPPDEQLAAASALYQAGKYTDAAQRLEQFLAANPKHAKAGAAALALGRSYAELKQYPKAISAYEKAIASRDAAVVPTAQLGLGEAAFYAGDYAKAAPVLEAASKTGLKPDQAPVVLSWLGRSDFELGRYAAAEDAYLKLTRDYPRSDLVANAYFGAGLAALRQNRGDVARQRFRTVIDRYPKSADRPRALVLVAQADLDAKRYREARAGFEAALGDPQGKTPELEVPAEEGLVQALLGLQDYPAAASRLDALVARLPQGDKERYRAQLTLGHCRYRQKQYEPALGAYKEAAKSTEGAVAGEGHYWAGNSALALNRTAEAVEQFTKVVTRFPKHELAAKAQLKIGDAQLAAKQPAAASTAYRAVIEKYPQAPEAGDARKALAQLVDAADEPAQLADALKTAPPTERARGTLRLARLYLAGKKYSDAIPPLTELLKTKPAPEVAGEAQYLLGLAYDVQNKTAPAAAAFGEAVRQSSSASWAADAQGRLAWLYLDLKKPADAERAAKAVLGARPAPDAERQARLALLRAQLDQQKWDDALAGCKVLLEGNPPKETVATVLYTQAWVTEKRGKPEEALPLWERLANEFSASEYAPEALLHVGDARFKAEKYDEARDEYAALLAAAPKSPLAPEGRFKLGSALYNLNRFPEAASEFDAVAADKAGGDYQPEALYWAGLALDKAGKKTDAIARLDKLVAQYPKHPLVAKAKPRLAALRAVTGR